LFSEPQPPVTVVAAAARYFLFSLLIRGGNYGLQQSRRRSLYSKTPDLPTHRPTGQWWWKREEEEEEVEEDDGGRQGRRL